MWRSEHNRDGCIHTLARPYTLVVGLKPTKTSPPEENIIGTAMLLAGILLSSPDVAGQHTRVLTACDFHVVDLLRGSYRHRKSLEHRHGLGSFGIQTREQFRASGI
ncbi:hypothetical protein EVAR_59284_1 [Eumeta japonica]|uniref:Uncharacterized protein n=1 Tax=Eumeta variegata TaxID=151549 RepID=A0A4C1T2D6_EUMVA|nr:hypothetical protein EVAR_59284_1 [Eumeta japonica]